MKGRTKRLGKNGVDDIIKHPFFASVDIDKLLAKEIDPPYKPSIKEDEYFDPRVVKE